MPSAETIELMHFDEDAYLSNGDELVSSGKKMIKLADEVTDEGYDAIFLMGVGGTFDEFIQLKYLMNKLGDRSLEVHLIHAAEWVAGDRRRMTQRSVVLTASESGITVNERLECLQDDILHQLSKLFPENEDYYHARFLHSYGAMAGNPTGHLKSMVTGNQATVPFVDGRLCLGKAQELFLAEFDGPQRRTITLTIIGE